LIIGDHPFDSDSNLQMISLYDNDDDQTIKAAIDSPRTQIANVGVAQPTFIIVLLPIEHSLLGQNDSLKVRLILSTHDILDFSVADWRILFFL
jgi:hypothetical protein